MAHYYIHINTYNNYKKKLPSLVYGINMLNLRQNNEIEHINKEINLLQDLLKKNNKIKN